MDEILTFRNLVIAAILTNIGLVLTAFYDIETLIFAVIILMVAYYPGTNTPLHLVG